MIAVEYQLNPEERKILEAFERGELSSVADVAVQIQRAASSALNTRKHMYADSRSDDERYRKEK